MLQVLLIFLFTNTAQALTLCEKWPEVTASAIPRLVSTGLPFTYKVRFDCDLGERFFADQFEGGFVHPLDTFPATSFLLTFPLEDGELLYQSLFKPRNNQRAGFYTFIGCVRIKNTITQQSICLRVPALQLEVVRVE